jgi:putative Mg2+ transporter-C (MgtC) family protein
MDRDRPLETIRTDPTRMAQGIMTGIGFLGAGVIFKENPSVRGLTTAASIWVTSALGICLAWDSTIPRSSRPG